LEKLFKVKIKIIKIIKNKLLILVVPHITDAIQEWVERVAHISVDENKSEPDICIIEVILNKIFLNKILFLFSLVEQLVILKVCHLLKHLDNFNFV
jgi:hypothetical protein